MIKKIEVKTFVESKLNFKKFNGDIEIIIKQLKNLKKEVNKSTDESTLDYWQKIVDEVKNLTDMSKEFKKENKQINNIPNSKYFEEIIRRIMFLTDIVKKGM